MNPDSLDRSRSFRVGLKGVRLLEDDDVVGMQGTLLKAVRSP